MGRQSAEVVIVGAGVVGSVLAYRLARRGHRVTILDRRAPGRGTTAATFGWTSAHGKEPLFYHRLNLASIDRFPALEDELGEAIGLRPCASLKPALADQAPEEARLRTLAKIEEGYQLRWLDDDEAHRLVPALGSDVVGASLCEEEGVVNPFLLVFSALEAARRLGATLQTGAEVVAFHREGDRITAVETRDRQIPCESVVLASGPWTAEVARLAGVEVALERVKGQLLVTERRPPCLEAVVGEIQQTPPGNFLLGVTWEEGVHDVETTLSGLGQISRQVCRLIPALAGVSVIRSYAGLRPLPRDGVSIVGATDQARGLSVAVTHSGVTLAPLLAELIADQLEGRRHPLWDERLAPDRFLEGSR